MSVLTLRLIAVLLIVVIGTISSAPGPLNTITLDEYNLIQVGWTKEHVTRVVGNTGITASASETTLTVIYEGTTPGAIATFLFIHGFVHSKTESGLV
jgi:hypothetical protein